MDKKIDCPEGAEFVGTSNGAQLTCFYKNVTAEGYYYIYAYEGAEWKRGEGTPYHQPLIPRPAAPAIDWSKAPEWADRVVVGPLSGRNYWANDVRRVQFNGEFDIKNTVHITDRWEVLEHRPAVAAWNGERLPPVGVVCEFSLNRGRVDWATGTVIGHDGPVQVVIKYGQGEYHARNIHGVRPIKTAEQIAAEAKAKEMAEMLTVFEAAIPPAWDTLAGIEALHKAGYRKQ